MNVKKFIYYFREAAKRDCVKHAAKGLYGVNLVEDLTPKAKLSYQLGSNRVFLLYDGISFEEFPYNERDMKGEDHRNIDVISLYTKIEMMLRDGEITEVDFEKLLFGMI